jgi:hypothetical protein
VDEEEIREIRLTGDSNMWVSIVHINGWRYIGTSSHDEEKRKRIGRGTKDK